MTVEQINLLIEEAKEVRKNAYARYSGFLVGAVLVSKTGKHYHGVNVENASYGLTICAERNAIFSGVTEEKLKISILCVVADTEEAVSPCGACRQVMLEFSDKETIIILANLKGKYKIFKMDDLLPYSFKI